jgi:hypothetical protein
MASGSEPEKLLEVIDNGVFRNSESGGRPKYLTTLFRTQTNLQKITIEIVLTTFRFLVTFHFFSLSSFAWWVGASGPVPMWPMPKFWPDESLTLQYAAFFMC